MSKNDRNDRSRGQNGSGGLPSAVKGAIGMMATTLVVVIITMLFAKSLFISNAASSNGKTGRITNAPTYSVSTSSKISIRTTHTTTTKHNEDDPYQTSESGSVSGGEALGEATAMTVISAVYLHPQPTSKSENLLVIPVGAICKVYRNEGGWLYLDYNGQMGYAYYTFFSGNLPPRQ